MAIAEKSDAWDAPEPEVEEPPLEEFIPSSQREEVELTSFDPLISSLQS
jgi:hypothetical protein